MVRFAKLIMIAGIFWVLVSAILLGYLNISSAEYWVDVLNMVLGGVMIFTAVLYLKITANKERKEVMK